MAIQAFDPFADQDDADPGKVKFTASGAPAPHNLSVVSGITGHRVVDKAWANNELSLGLLNPRLGSRKAIAARWDAETATWNLGTVSDGRPDATDRRRDE